VANADPDGTGRKGSVVEKAEAKPLATRDADVREPAVIGEVDPKAGETAADQDHEGREERDASIVRPRPRCRKSR
jgi:hypothetical protein